MAKRPDITQRIADLVEAGTATFIERGGYGRTQVADVARTMGVAPGTIYLYVESKEALFDLLVRAHNDLLPERIIDALPYPAPAPGATVGVVEQTMKRRAASATLKRALRGDAGPPTAGEYAAIVGELYETMAARRQVIKLIDRSARDFPELAEVWLRLGRLRLMRDFGRYITRGTEAGVLRDTGDAPLAARMVMEHIVYWAVHQHWDVQPVGYGESELKEKVVSFASRCLVADASPV